MYEPVATFIQGKTESFIEGELLKVTQEMGLDVDREELLKALKYDRGQYEKGYQDGASASRVHGSWKDGVCTHCGFDLRELTDGENDLEQWVWDDGFPYCPNCGARMDGGNDNA